MSWQEAQRWRRSDRLYGDAARAYLKSKKVHRYRMKKISEMDDDQVSQACHHWYEENNLVEDYQAFQALYFQQHRGEYLAVYPINNQEEGVPMFQESSREDLTQLVRAIQTVRDPETGRELTEAEHTALVVKFAKGIPHPGGSDLIYYPQLVEGFPRDREPSVEEIVDMALREI